MRSKLVDPMTHKDWLSPHSFAWYAQLGKLKGQYSYPWNSTMSEPNGETIFTEEVSQMVRSKRVLDIGCGHGDFTVRMSGIVKQIVGLDVTRDFIETSDSSNLANVSFVMANTKEQLPFGPGEFDCAYNRKGPTSAYLDLKRIIKKGGQVLALHPGDSLSPELPQLFPNLFEPQVEGTPILDKIKSRLAEAKFTQADIETVSHVQYLHEPMDVVKLRCFGQTLSVHDRVIDESMPEIERIFMEQATERGLVTTFEYYIVRVTV